MHDRRVSGLPCPLVAVLAVTWIGTSSSAYGQATPLELAWSAPAACPSRETVLDEVNQILGHAGPGSPTRARVDVSSDEGGRWHAALSVQSRGLQGERDLEAESCSAIASAVALIVAVAVERGVPPELPGPSAAPPPPPPAPPPLTVVSAPTRVAATSPSVSPAPSHHESRLLVGADATLDGFIRAARTMPGFAVGADASAGWLYAWGPFRFRAVGTGTYFPHASAHARSTDEGGDFDLFTVAGRACLAFAAALFDVGPCVGAEFDSMQTTHIDAQEPQPAAAQWWSLLGSALAHAHLTRSLALSLRLDALGVVGNAPSFKIRAPATAGGPYDVVQPSSFSIRAGLGLEAYFF
jgi:hypothetical protein